MEVKKVRGMLLPTFVMLGIYLLYAGESYTDALFTVSKRGYWFTIVSFEMYTLYALSRVLTPSEWSGWKQLLLLCMPMAIVWFLSVTIIKRDSSIGVLLEMANLRQYILCFIAGLVSKMFLQKFNAFFSNKLVISVLFLLAVPLPYIFSQIPWAFVKLSRVLVVYACFYSYRDFFNKNTIVGRSLSFIGKHTLEIYFLHYFFFSQMIGVDILLCRWCSVSWLYELFIVVPISIVVCYLCILVRYILKPFRFVSELCFGPSKS